MSRFLLLTFLFAFAPSLVAQNDLEARLDAVKEFSRYFKKAKDEPSQIAAIETLNGNECVPAAEELFQLLGHKSPAVQDAALTVLSTFHEPATFEAWITALPEIKDPNTVALLVKVLGQSKQAAAVPAIEAVVMAGNASSTLKYEAARALTAIGNAGTAGVLAAIVKDPEPIVRMAAADAIGVLKVKDQAQAVTDLLGDDQWQVQSAAIEAVAQLRPQGAVQPLIDLMRKTGRLRTECAEALFRITTLDFGVDPDRWQEQWDKLMAIQGWRIPNDEELAQKIANRKKYDAFYGKKEETNAFVGIPTTSTNVLFVIDVSGSMDDMVTEVDKFREYRDRRRFTIVQTELLNTIETLTGDTNFNIVAFATDTKAWKPRLVPANIVNRDAAASFVRRLKPIGGTEDQQLAQSGLGVDLEAGKTNTLKALLYAFGVDPDKPQKAALTGFDKKAIKQPLDTVYFLSDGRPSVGKLIEPLEILAEVRKYNELYRLVIHTIAIGEFEKSFLETLAQQNGGVFVDLGR